MLRTTHGLLEEATLARTVGFEDRPTEFVVWVEWRLCGHDATGCPHCATPECYTDATRPTGISDALVRRDAHVILKQPSVTADAVAGGLK